MAENITLSFFDFFSFFQNFFSLLCGGDGFCASCGLWVLWLVVGVVVMGFVAGCGCGDDGFCGFFFFPNW